MDELTDIAVFLRVVETGSFTLAAQQLNQSRSVTSKYVTRLEARLGVRLLNRTTRQLSLTEAGETLFAHGSKALDALRDAQSEIAQLQSEPRGTLRVTAPMSFGLLRLASLMPQFLAAHPDVKVDLLLDDRVVDLVGEGLDLAIRISRGEDSSLVERKLMDCPQVVCAAPAYLKAQGTPTSPEQLREHNCVTYVYARTPGQWQFTDAAGKRYSIAVRGSYQVNNGLAQREAALQGTGFVFLPTFYVAADLAAGRLVPVLDDFETLPLSICAVYPERRYLLPKVRTFVDFLSARLGEDGSNAEHAR